MRQHRARGMFLLEKITTSGGIADRDSRGMALLPRGLVPVSPIRETDSSRVCGAKLG